jgi:hypothetical protein
MIVKITKLEEIMRNINRITAMLLAVLLLCLVGCGGGDNKPKQQVVNVAAIAVLPAPVFGGTPVTSTSGMQYTGTVTWAPAVSGTFAAGTVYTASITLTARSGYTLEGIAANFFTVAGATAANAVNSGVVTAVFPATIVYDVPPQIEIDVYDGGTKLVAIAAEDLEAIEQKQKLVRMVTSGSGGSITDRVYVAYAIADVLEYLGVDLPEFAAVKYRASDGYENSAGNQYAKTNFNRAYIAIGYVTGAGITGINTSGAPRVIPDTQVESSDHILQRIDRITVNPIP